MTAAQTPPVRWSVRCSRRRRAVDRGAAERRHRARSVVVVSPPVRRHPRRAGPLAVLPHRRGRRRMAGTATDTPKRATHARHNPPCPDSVGVSKIGAPWRNWPCTGRLRSVAGRWREPPRPPGPRLTRPESCSIHAMLARDRRSHPERRCMTDTAQLKPDTRAAAWMGTSAASPCSLPDPGPSASANRSTLVSAIPEAPIMADHRTRQATIAYPHRVGQRRLRIPRNLLQQATTPRRPRDTNTDRIRENPPRPQPDRRTTHPSELTPKTRSPSVHQSGSTSNHP